MSWTKHHAIIVTCGHGDYLSRAHSAAKSMGMTVSEIVQSPLNAVDSFMVAPDGSNEGHPPSDVGDAQRAALITTMDAMRHSDGSSPLRWVSVAYGEDDRLAPEVEAHSNEESRYEAANKEGET